MWDVQGQGARVVYFESLAPDCFEFESCQRVWILLCDEAIQLAFGMSVVLHVHACALNNTLRGVWPEVFPHQ